MTFTLPTVLEVYLFALCVCFGWQGAPWEILPQKQGLFRLLPGQAVTVVFKLTLPPDEHTPTHTAVTLCGSYTCKLHDNRGQHAAVLRQETTSAHN